MPGACRVINRFCIWKKGSILKLGLTFKKSLKLAFNYPTSLESGIYTSRILVYRTGFWQPLPWFALGSFVKTLKYSGETPSQYAVKYPPQPTCTRALWERLLLPGNEPSIRECSRHTEVCIHRKRIPFIWSWPTWSWPLSGTWGTAVKHLTQADWDLLASTQRTNKSNGTQQLSVAVWQKHNSQ